MKTVRPQSVAAFCLALTLGTAWGEPSKAAEPSAQPAEKSTAGTATPPGPSGDAASLVKLPTPESPPSTPSAARADISSGIRSEHLPLALFSLGSLAVGGVFYGISATSRGSDAASGVRDRSQLTTAIGAAGLGALLAAGSYFYYVHHPAGKDGDPEGDWAARVTGGVSPEGGPVIGALLTLPLPSPAR